MKHGERSAEISGATRQYCVRFHTRGMSDRNMCWFFFSSRRRHTRLQGDWSSDVCSSDLLRPGRATRLPAAVARLRPGTPLVLFASQPFVQDRAGRSPWVRRKALEIVLDSVRRSEEHTSELQSPCNLVCRLLLEKKKH